MFSAFKSQSPVNAAWVDSLNFYRTSDRRPLCHSLATIPNLSGTDRLAKVISRLREYYIAECAGNRPIKPGPDDERYIKLILTAVALGEELSEGFWASLALNNGGMKQYGSSVKLDKPYPIKVAMNILLHTLIDPMGF